MAGTAAAGPDMDMGKPPIELLTDSFERMAKIDVAKGMSLEESMAKYTTANPRLLQEEIFMDMFPICYNIALCQHKQANNPG